MSTRQVDPAAAAASAARLEALELWRMRVPPQPRPPVPGELGRHLARPAAEAGAPAPSYGDEPAAAVGDGPAAAAVDVPAPSDSSGPADSRDGGLEGPALLPESAGARQAAELARWAVPGQTRPADQPAPPAPSGGVVALGQLIDLVAATPTSGRPVDVAALLRCAERLRGLALHGLGELDATGTYTTDGAASAAAWLRRTQNLADDTARATLRLAQRTRTDLPQLTDLLICGGTTLEHLRAVAAGTTGLDPALVNAAQPALADLVATAPPAIVRRQLRERAEAINPELGRNAAHRQHARQGFYATALAGHGIALGGSLCEEDGATLLHGLDLAVQADRTTGDTRTLPARRAATLIHWARQAALHAAGPGDTLASDAHTVRNHLLITCDLQQLAALTTTADASTDNDGDGDRDGDDGSADGAPDLALDLLTGTTPTRPALLPTGAHLLPEQLRRLACDTTLTLIVTPHLTGAQRQPAPFAPLYVGRSSRTVTGAQFTALVVRDRTCIVAGCHRPPTQCQAHHVQHWLDGGHTDLDNLILLCHTHHHDHHDRGHDLPHRDGRWITTTGWAHAPP